MLLLHNRNDPYQPGCKVGPCSDQVDDSELRGKSNDPRTAKDLDRGIEEMSAQARITGAGDGER